MGRQHSRQHRSTRGQGLVELALVMPVLVLMLVLAIDVGRLYFGWVALQNAARIGASQAAEQADDWHSGDATVRDQYQRAVLNDLQALNCSFAGVPDPVFSGYDDGDHVRVDLGCSFDLVTPLADNIIGGPVDLGASAEFAVHRRINARIPVPPAPPPAGDCTVPDFTDGDRKNQADGIWADPPANFTSTLAKVGGSGNWLILDQDPPAGTVQPCDAPGTVYDTVQP